MELQEGLTTWVLVEGREAEQRAVARKAEALAGVPGACEACFRWCNEMSALPATFAFEIYCQDVRRPPYAESCGAEGWTSEFPWTGRPTWP